MARALFNGVMARDKQVVAVRPKKELEPFFKVSYECPEKSLAGDPDRHRARDQQSPRRTSGRSNLGGERARRREHVQFHVAQVARVGDTIGRLNSQSSTGGPRLSTTPQLN